MNALTEAAKVLALAYLAGMAYVVVALAVCVVLDLRDEWRRR